MSTRMRDCTECVSPGCKSRAPYVSAVNAFDILILSMIGSPAFNGYEGCSKQQRELPAQ